jgi:hypothetical protein
MEMIDMVGLGLAIIIFNFIAFKTNKRLTANQIIHIWSFTIAAQAVFDTYVDARYHGYWYFSLEIDWKTVPALLLLVPPVNMMFLNWYPLKNTHLKQILYIFFWVIGILIYEVITLLPEPWGYFHYGWWNLGYSAVLDPLLLFIVLRYYKWICKAENKLLTRDK